jgi:spore maturation protein CgeB
MKKLKRTPRIGNRMNQTTELAGKWKGWAHGYHTGMCEGLLSRVTGEEHVQHDIRVLYVRTGLHGPFPAMDQALVHTLGGLVREVSEVSPKQDIVRIARERRPDLLLVLHGTLVPPAVIDQIRSLGIRTAIWMVDDPYISDVTMVLAPHYDDVFTHELACIPYYRELGCRVHYLPLGVDTMLYRPKYVPPFYQSDICFIGNAFWNRVHTIDRIAPFLAGRDSKIVGLLWRRLRHYGKLRRSIRVAWVSAEEASCYYNGAKIVINMHRSHDDKAHNRNRRNIPGMSINPRTYEISACGAFQLTDIRQDLSDHYIPGIEVATYSTPGELADRISYYLSNEDERRGIAMKGMLRSFREHSYEKRISRMLDILYGRGQVRQV